MKRAIEQPAADAERRPERPENPAANTAPTPSGQRAPRRVRPSRRAGEATWRVAFRHPLRDGRLVTAYLGTQEEAEAELVCRDLSVFVNAPGEFTNIGRAAEAGYRHTALRIWFGEEPPRRTPTPWEILVEGLCAKSAQARQHFREYVPALEAKVAALAPRVEELEAELARLRRQANVHAKVVFPAAVELWRQEYARAHARKTVRDAVAAVRAFCAFVVKHSRAGQRVKLSELGRTQIAAWLTALRSPSEPPLSPTTLRNKLSYLSAFWTWAVERYDLIENPVHRVGKPAGLVRRPEQIRAVSEPEQITELLAAYSESAYWRAWLAVAMLAGPRWCDQCRIRLCDVSLRSREIVIVSRKTGKRSVVPIERTVLLPILREWIQIRQAQGQGEDPEAPLFRQTAAASALPIALRSDLLFPATSGTGTKPRLLSAPGIWSDSSTWHSCWRRARQAAWRRYAEQLRTLGQPVPTTMPRHWLFGPREWRHSAGAAMGHAGLSSLQISQWLGNSEAVARKHYIPPVQAEPWPFKW